IWLRALCLPPIAFPLLFLFSGLFQKKILDNYELFIKYQNKDFDSAFMLWKQIPIQQKYKQEKRKLRRAWFAKLAVHQKNLEAESLGSTLWIEKENDLSHNKDFVKFLMDINLTDEGKYFRLFLRYFEKNSNPTLARQLLSHLDLKTNQDLDHHGIDLKQRLLSLQ
ncbi:hypothetical protein MJH12_04615, partial [bacterium]|nr:hypothetical protein [bacterium]